MKNELKSDSEKKMITATSTLQALFDLGARGLNDITTAEKSERSRYLKKIGVVRYSRLNIEKSAIEMSVI